MKTSWLMVVLLAGCGVTHKSKPSSPAPDLVERLRAKEAGWLAELTAKADQATGWPSARDCDATLWAGLARAGGQVVPIELAEYNPGEIHRRPKVAGECYPLESASTVSNDMLLGYMWALWASRDRAGLERLASYGEAHSWVMGEPYPAEPRVVLSPSGRGLLGRAIEKLGGATRAYSVFPETCLPVAADYEVHLQTLAILLDGEERGGTSSLCYDRLRANASASQRDALFQAALGVYSGSQDQALGLLTDDSYETPTYVRGAETYPLVHRIFAARVTLGGFSTVVPGG